MTDNLMRGRLGQYARVTNIPEGENNITLQAAQFKQHGGYYQQERMIQDKRRSLDKALNYSYQGADVQSINSTEVYRALINPNKLKPDYDDKIISIGFESNFKPGTIFHWQNTNTYWMIYLQDYTELAYFRGDIRECSHQISWEDSNGNQHSSYIALTGPTEGKITSIIKNKVTIDVPNYSIHVLIPKNEDTIEYFVRYKKFYLNGTCWRIEAVDNISLDNIIEFYAVEYYANKTEDDIEAGIVGGLIEEIADPNLTADIKGETFIKPKLEYTYSALLGLEGDWHIPSNLPVEWWVNSDNTITLSWKANYSGQFKVYYGNYEKTIIVESLF